MTVFGKLKYGQVFLVIDLNGYYHIPIREQDCHKTTFISPSCKMQFKIMAQSLSGALFTFSEGIDFAINNVEEFCDNFFELCDCINKPVVRTIKSLRYCI